MLPALPVSIFISRQGALEKKYIFESLEGGVAVFDYDRDGWEDIFFVNGTTMQWGESAEAPLAKALP